MNKKIISKKILLSLIMATILSCGKDDDVTNPAEATNVYVVGYEQNSNINQAKFWKNGTIASLPTTGKASVASAVFVSGKDVFIAGQEAMSSATDANRQIKLWKNGLLAKTITDGSQDAVANDLYVVGNDVYITGVEFNGTNNVAKFWKNGTPTNLTDGTKEGVANAISVSEGNVYVAGSEFDGMNNVLKVWKNGVAQNLNSGAKSAEANALFVSDNDVYVAGEEQGTAKFWKNGVATVITTKNARATGIYVLENIVYVTFEEYNAETKKWQGKLWKNGQITNISNGTQNCSLTGISVDANDIYVIGSESKGIVDVAKIWKNGTATSLTNGTQKATALDIAVVKQ
ncbi:Kelch repeat-containing protein [Flavobacterium chungangense]|uniref:Uncharacterized protein n=1 Tax=Flavobacterium chungangense TaxID=554283 RepID=A0A6V6Z6N8_9FLAO|nr:hypothetical protein [Flavobacterium chungangense]CAD0007458.1 hypothetical protein FLACHUCJ7_03308 [Flavobacterium chungangense]